MKGLRTGGIGTLVLLAVLALTVVCLLAPRPARAASAAEIENNARAALENLYSTSAEAKMLGREARAILVFPSIVKAGFLFGGQYGDGAMFEHGRAVGYYNSSGVSYGLQAGVESFSYALFFMSSGAIEYLRESQGLEIGTGPNVVVLDEGMAKSLSSTTLTQDVYAMIFGQQGLMAGIGLQGSKITRINP
jgi:lipid-binding SYLF domain-containing protein